MTRAERYELRMAQRAEKQKKADRIASFNLFKALELMLKRLNMGNFEKAKEILLKQSSREGIDYVMRQKSKSVYEFDSIELANELGLIACVFIIDVDVDRYEAFCNSLRSRFKATFDYFEIMKFEDCVIALN